MLHDPRCGLGRMLGMAGSTFEAQENGMELEGSCQWQGAALTRACLADVHRNLLFVSKHHHGSAPLKNRIKNILH